MFSEMTKKEYYQALLNKNSNYEGVFFVGVKTTGVFCRPTCAARKPKYANCEFFKTAKQAVLASFRPCKRCSPLSSNQVSKTVQVLLDAIDKNPERRWKDRDLRALSIDMTTARRQFKKRFGMTFVEYARARRMGLALKQIREGDAAIEAQLSAGYESGSGFRDAFSKIMGAAPAKSKNAQVLHAAWLDTPLGPMMAIADEKALYLLEFVDRRGLEKEMDRLKKKWAIIPGRTGPIDSIERELSQYFTGQLKEFKTPICKLGSPFQTKVWEELQKIPYGETRSYAEIADGISRPTAYRAVAQANGANQLALIIPCHRVINTGGSLGGYGGGIARKQWLIEHEKQCHG